MVISPNMHVCICFLHHFWIWFQPWWWLCNLESMLPQYMIWLSSGSVFWSNFNHDSHCVIQRLFCCIIWYGYHLAPFFNVISTMMVIMETVSLHHIIWLSSNSSFWCEFNCSNYSHWNYIKNECQMIPISYNDHHH